MSQIDYPVFDEIEKFEQALADAGDEQVTVDAYVTSEVALLIKENHNLHNIRDLKKGRVQTHQTTIKNGEWDHRIGGIHFTGDGILRNGQHRLEAIWQSGQTVLVRFEFNMPEFAENYFDLSSFSRTSVDALYRLGAQVPSGPSAVSSYSAFLSEGATVQSQEYTKFFEAHPGLKEALLKANIITQNVRSSLNGVISPGRILSASLILLMHGASEHEVETFWNEVAPKAGANHAAGFATMKSIQGAKPGGSANIAVVHKVLWGFIKWLGDEKPKMAFKETKRVSPAELVKAIENSHTP